VIAIKKNRCTECGICMEICSWSHFGENNLKRSRIWVSADWPHVPTIKVCLACQDHECVEVCPADALEWNGWIRLNADACDFCGACVDACPVDGILLDPKTNLPLICDTCSGSFECTRWCPTNAIEIGG